jgi:hypothetical protein
MTPAAPSSTTTATAPSDTTTTTSTASTTTSTTSGTVPSSSNSDPAPGGLPNNPFAALMAQMMADQPGLQPVSFTLTDRNVRKRLRRELCFYVAWGLAAHLLQLLLLFTEYGSPEAG